jgi:acyl-CoA synthetase (AMP-forming)/AMP-acid ligase II
MPVFFDSRLLQDLRRFPADRPVMVQKGTAFSAEDLYKDAQNIALGLSEKGFQPGSRVLMLVRPDISFSKIVYALAMLGAEVALLDPEMGPQHFDAKKKQFNPHWVFVDRALLLLAEHPVLRFLYLRFARSPFYVGIPKSCRLVSTGNRFLPLLRKTIPFTTLLRKRSADIQWTQEEDRAFLITYTSGTLDAPKGVVHTFRNLYESIGRIREIQGFKGTIGAYLPHFLLMGISTGNTVCMFDKNLDAPKRLKLIEAHNIAILFGPPSDFTAAIEYCEKHRISFPPCLKLILLGSAPVYPTFLKKLRAVLAGDTLIQCTYGMTENLLVAMASDQEKCAFTGEGDYLGRPVNGLSVNIADDGEILLQSSQLFERYLDQKDRVTPHPTGDLGYIDTDGALVLLGRKKDMIIRRDTNVYPALYEKTILGIPGVRDCAMVGIYSQAKHDEEIWLCVDAKGLDVAALRKALMSGLKAIDKEAQPDHIVFTAIPRSGRQNKIDRAALRRSLVP